MAAPKNNKMHSAKDVSPLAIEVVDSGAILAESDLVARSVSRSESSLDSHSGGSIGDDLSDPTELITLEPEEKENASRQDSPHVPLNQAASNEVPAAIASESPSRRTDADEDKAVRPDSPNGRSDGSPIELSTGITFKPGVMTQIQRVYSYPNYLGGMKRIIAGRVGVPHAADLQVTHLLEDDPNILADLPRGVEVLGVLVVNRGANPIQPPLACHERPCLVVDVLRDQDKGTLVARCGVLKPGAILDDSQELKRQLFRSTLFDEFKHGSVVVRAWRSCWIDLWQRTLDNRSKELSGFLGGRINISSRTIDVCGFIVDGHGGPHGVTLDSEHFGPAEAEFGRKGWRVVGWWHTHPSQGVFLSQPDRQKHFQLFPPPASGNEAKRGWDLSVALVLAPHSSQRRVRAGFFLPIARGSAAVIGERLAESPFIAQADEQDWGILEIDPPAARPAGNTFLLDPLIVREENEGTAFEEEEEEQQDAKKPRHLLRIILASVGIGLALILSFIVTSRLFGHYLNSPTAQHNILDRTPPVLSAPSPPTKEVYRFMLKPDVQPDDINCVKNHDHAGYWTLGPEGATKFCRKWMKPHRVEPIGSESSWGWREPCPQRLKIQIRPTIHLFIAATKFSIDETYSDWQLWFCRNCPCEVSFVSPGLKYDSEQHHTVEVNYIVSPERHLEVPPPALR